MKELNDSFEKQWREQFQEAEKTPGDAVWDRIDAGLAGDTLNRYRKKLLFYKWVAAASILLAVLFGSVSLYTYLGDRNNPQLANMEDVVDVQSEGESGDTRPELTYSPPASGKDDETTVAARSEIREPGSISTASESASSFKEDRRPQFTSLQPMEDTEVLPAVMLNEKEEAAESSMNYLSGIFQVPYEKPGRKYRIEKKINPYDQPYLVPLEMEDDNEDDKRLWAGVSFSSGVFDPNISYDGQSGLTADATPSFFGSVDRIYTNSADMQEASKNIMSYKPEESSYQSNVTYSYGLDFGYKFSKRFVILGGMSYQQNHGSTSVRTYVEPASTNSKYANHVIVIERAGPEYGLSTYNELGSEVELNSTFEFVTIPVSMGYYLIDKKFKWLMTAGLSTDLFIKNNIEDEQNLFDQIEYRTGDESPYNPVYFNGRFGTMLNYTFSRHYQLSLEPSYRIGISSLTKDNAAFNSRPSSFLITAGVSFVF